MNLQQRIIRSQRVSFFVMVLISSQSRVAVAQIPDSDASAGAIAGSASEERSMNFVRDIQPILQNHCYECHAGTTEEGGLNLGVRAKALQGGDSGAAILPGKAHKSLLFELVSARDEDRLMPPEGNAPLTKQQIESLEAWIEQGAPWPDGADVTDPKAARAKSHWAFQRLQPTAVPKPATDSSWPKSAIDQFVLNRLQAVGLRPAKPANARTLVRRLYFDLIGLPPTPKQTHQFIVAHSEDADAAVSNLVNQLLDSPQYGERWGRHWLDVARYADSDGQESDMDRPHAYTYRDFVIQAFNENMPYDQFVRWQIAGDEIAPNSDAAVAATGFLTAGPAFKLPDSFLESERLLNRYNELDDVISTLGSGLLGITVACARCHDHKYDAFTAKEYYQLLGVFHSGDRVTGKLPSGKDAFYFKDYDEKRRTTWLFRRSDFYDREIEVPIGFPSLLSDGSDAESIWRSVQDAYRNEFGDAKSTLQRRALAEWITDTQRGGGTLLARVFVNRIWHHHFGDGIVQTTSDFGVRGDTPSHPEMLEYLTFEFVQSGWDIKSLHRNILTSATWQQSSTADAADERGAQVDPSNRLLWHRTPQRLEAEILRDAMLAVSDTLNLQAGGPGFKPYIAPEANLARNIKGESYPKDAKDDASTRRRSVYMFHKRLIPYPMFQAFDRPDLMTSCARRQNTTVAPQAMVILNDRFVRAVAGDFATELDERTAATTNATAELEPVIRRAFETAFVRLPTSTEVESSIQFIESQITSRSARDGADPRTEALTDFCQALFGLNEFIYVD